MQPPVDDLGNPVAVHRPVARVVSLVPSLTETIASVNPAAIAGATTYCTHPAELTTTRIRGTKNPGTTAIIDLAPDIVLANKEENRQLDVQRLRAAGIPVWVTDIRTLDAAFASLRRVFTHALGWTTPSWLDQAQRAWDKPVTGPRRRTVIAIWRDPWMVVGPDTFTTDIAARLGLDNAYTHAASRYPHTSIEEITAHRPDLVLLPDEPYPFNADDGPEAFPHTRTVLLEGRLLTWYGPSLTTARTELLNRLE